MKFNKNVLRILINNSNKDSLLNFAEAVINHEEEYDYKGNRVNNIINIIAGEKVKDIYDINMDVVIDNHTDWLFEKNNWHIIKDSIKPVKVDNISGEVTISYEYTIDSDNIVHSYNFTLNYLDYPDILK